MKAIILCLALIATASGQLSEEFLTVQRELEVGHEFAESLFQINRNIISSYIEIVEAQLLDSFMDTYSEMHIIADETTQLFDELNVENPCVASVRSRWDIQIHRHGQKLSECLVNSLAEVRYWNDFVNKLNLDTQATTNLIQNSGVAVLSEVDEFTSTTNIAEDINIRLMLTLRNARPYLDTYEDFRASIIDNEEQIIQQLTMCDRSLANAFAIEAREDFERAESCL